MEEQDRPLGITILSILGLVVGGWNLMVAMFALTYTSSMVVIGALSGVPPGYGPAYAALENVGVVLLGIGAAVALMVAAWGLYMLRRWAYWLAVAGAGLSLLVHVLPAFQGAVNGTSTFSALLAAGILVYLFLPGVRRAFFESQVDVPPRPA
jgi:hypothetical protein